MEENYELIDCPNCHFSLESTRFCQNCEYEFFTLDEYNKQYLYPLKEIMKQAIEKEGCNCENCCSSTPLHEQIIQDRRDRYIRNKVRIEDIVRKNKINESKLFLESQGYVIDKK